MSNQIDGDKLDIDYTPSNYTPETVTEADDLDHLSAHLSGIDTTLGTTVSEHAYTHLTDGDDEIDGDKLDITYTPEHYTPSTAPSEVDNLDHLSSHLAGINTALSFENVKGWAVFSYTPEFQMIGDFRLIGSGSKGEYGFDYEEGETVPAAFTIYDTYNVSTVTRAGAGSYNIVWDTDFANTNYCVVGTAAYTWWGIAVPLIMNFDTLLVGSVNVKTINPSAVLTDATSCFVIAIGDQ